MLSIDAAENERLTSNAVKVDLLRKIVDNLILEVPLENGCKRSRVWSIARGLRRRC